MKKFLLLAFCIVHCLYAAEKTTYAFTLEPIDVVIPCHPKDAAKLNLVIPGIRENVKNVRNIYVISTQKVTEKAAWFDEAQFPFNKESVALEVAHGSKALADKLLNRPGSRIGWIYQQLLKLYAAFVIPEISSNVLIVDADTIFLNKVAFQDDQGAPLFNPGTEHHKPYFVHGSQLIPGFKRVFPQHSGISHHMLFQRCVLQDMFDVVRNTHSKEPWRAMCQFINPGEGSGISEYELYFNFLFMSSNQGKIRPLKWHNGTNQGDLARCNHYKSQGYHYISCHTWL